MSWLNEFPDAKHVTIAAPDLNGQARGKRIPKSKAGKLTKGTAKMPLSALSLDILGNDIEDSPLVFETGDKDGFLRPTDRGPMVMPWLAEPGVLLPVSMFTVSGRPFEGDPRNALQAVVDRFENKGLHVHAATELEFYLVDETDPTPLAVRLAEGGDILGLRTLEAYDPFLNDLYAACRQMGISAETATSESGSGQFEITLTHGPALKIADDTWLFKMLAKGLAHRHGMAATFMAKPMAQDAGSGMHVHFSITDDDGRNVFDDGTNKGSDTLLHAVQGCLHSMREASLIFAPHQNSYLRLVPGAHAPTSICWGYENRTAAIRIPDGPGLARRIEHRVAGGDINPYLLLTAILGGALLGIENAEVPPSPMSGNAYDQSFQQLAEDWPAAIELFRDSEDMKRIFPKALIDQLVLTKLQEVAVVKDRSPSELLDLYFDRV